MDAQLPLEFKARLTNAFDRSEFDSMRALSLASGLSESRIHKMLTGQFDHSKDGPGFFTIIRICKQLGITPDHLAGIDRWQEHSPQTTLNALNLLQTVSQSHSPPSVSELVRRYIRSGQRIEAFEDLLDYCDVYEAPDDETRTVTVRSVGEKSLAALRMKENSVTVLQTAYDSATPEFREQIFASHQKAVKNGMTVEADVIDERMNNRPIHVKIEYLRVALSLTDADGRSCLLIYCELIPL